MNRDLDDERRLLDISRWQREALKALHRVDWDEAVALALAIAILSPYLIFLVITTPI